MPNEHPMMSREEYHRRFPDDPTGPVERLTPDEEVLVNALRSVVGGALSPLGLYHLTGLLRIIERLSGDGTPPLDELRCRITGNQCGTDTWMVGHPCQCDNCQAWLRGRAEPAEGERLTDWTNEESVPKEVVLAFQRECENIDPDSVPSYWTVAAALVAAMNVRAALRDGGAPRDGWDVQNPEGYCEAEPHP